MMKRAMQPRRPHASPHRRPPRPRNGIRAAEAAPAGDRAHAQAHDLRLSRSAVATSHRRPRACSGAIAAIMTAARRDRSGLGALRRRTPSPRPDRTGGSSAAARPVRRHRPPSAFIPRRARTAKGDISAPVLTPVPMAKLGRAPARVRPTCSPGPNAPPAAPPEMARMLKSWRVQAAARPRQEVRRGGQRGLGLFYAQWGPFKIGDGRRPARRRPQASAGYAPLGWGLISDGPERVWAIGDPRPRGLT